MIEALAVFLLVFICHSSRTGGGGFGIESLMDFTKSAKFISHM